VIIKFAMESKALGIDAIDVAFKLASTFNSAYHSKFSIQPMTKTKVVHS
jgi:hypothetical protein